MSLTGRSYIFDKRIDKIVTGHINFLCFVFSFHPDSWIFTLPLSFPACVPTGPKMKRVSSCLATRCVFKRLKLHVKHNFKTIVFEIQCPFCFKYVLKWLVLLQCITNLSDVFGYTRQLQKWRTLVTHGILAEYIERCSHVSVSSNFQVTECGIVRKFPCAWICMSQVQVRLLYLHYTTSGLVLELLMVKWWWDRVTSMHSVCVPTCNNATGLVLNSMTKCRIKWWWQ